MPLASDAAPIYEGADPQSKDTLEHLGASALAPRLFGPAAQQPCGDGVGRGGGHDQHGMPDDLGVQPDLVLLLQLKFHVSRTLVRATCSGGLRRLEHGVAFVRHPVGLFHGSQSDRDPGLVGGDGLAVSAGTARLRHASSTSKLTPREQAGHAQARAAAEQLKIGSHQHIPRSAGIALAAGLAVRDAVPAYWSAQAFGLDQTFTIISTVLLCAALGGAMWLLDLFTSQRRRRTLRILQASLAAGLLALFVLWLDYLQVTGAASFWVTAIEAFALTALSAVLVTVGYVLLAHRVPKTLAAAQRAARQASATPAAQAAQEAHAQASASRDARTHRHHLGPHVPQDGISYDQLLPALRQALTTLLNQ